MEAVRGLTGRFHASEGEWDKSGNKLETLCGSAVGPNHRERDLGLVDCDKCKDKLINESWS